MNSLLFSVFFYNKRKWEHAKSNWIGEFFDEVSEEERKEWITKIADILSYLIGIKFDYAQRKEVKYLKRVRQRVSNAPNDDFAKVALYVLTLREG